LADLKETKFMVLLTPEDRYRHHHIRFKGKVLRFVIQYETLRGGHWVPVVRYDTEHGFAHRDLFDPSGRRAKTPLFVRSHDEALSFAEYDIKSNWRSYKEAFLKGGDQ
jgi:hypothetical protein